MKSIKTTTLSLSIVLLAAPLLASAEKIPEEKLNGITFTPATTMIDFTKGKQQKNSNNSNASTEAFIRRLKIKKKKTTEDYTP